MRIASGTIASAAVVALLSPMMAQPAHAQRAVRQSQVTGITILVRNIDDKSDAARIQSGGTITIAEGAHVRVNVEAQLYDSRTPVYPVTEFTDLNRGGVRITRGNAANGAVDLEVLPMRNPVAPDILPRRLELRDHTPAQRETSYLQFIRAAIRGRSSPEL